MLEGLEVSEVNISLINREKRINSEYFLKEYITEDNYLAKHNVVSIGEYAFITDGQHGYHEIDNNSNIHLLTAKNAKNWFANLDGADPLAQWVDDYNRRSSLQNNDIILSTRGSIGYAAIVKADVLPANIDQDVARINIIKQNELIPEFTITYLNSKYGQNWMFRNQTGMVQQGLSLEKVREMPIPLLPIGFQQNVAKIVQKSYVCFNESNNRYLEAEKSLLKELGLLDWQPNNDNTSIKHFIDFLSSGRLDAEYYQPKYDELEAILKKSSHKTIAELQVYNMRGVQPDYVENGEISVVNSKHILEDGLDYDNFEHTTTGFLNNHERARIGYGDVLIYTTGANIGRAQVYLKEEPAVASNHVNILRVQGVNPVYLAIVLNSQVGRMQTEKLCTGSAQAELYPTDIEKFIVPILPDKTQQTISDYVQKSFSLRQQAKQLLEDAKLKVETAITGGGGNNQIVTKYIKLMERSSFYYRMAEWTLIQELYADSWTATASVNYSVKPYSVSQSTGRLDAEYYQPKYDALFNVLSHFECNTIAEIATMRKSIEPGSDAYKEEGVPFVRVSDITKYGISEPNIYLSRTEYNVEKLRPKKDTILLSKDGSVGIAYKVEEDMDSITSGALLHLNVYNKDYLPDYLTLVLNSVVVQLQAERDSNGAIIQHWKPSEIEQVVIPQLPMETQHAIATKIQESFALRKESKRLLEQAKQMVEQEIENH